MSRSILSLVRTRLSHGYSRLLFNALGHTRVIVKRAQHYKNIRSLTHKDWKTGSSHFYSLMLGGIAQVTFINGQIEQGKSFRDAVRDCALLRLRPVLMTASVTILGLLPMLLSQGIGAETQRRSRPSWWVD